MTSPSPDRDDPQVLRAMLNDARESYGRLLALTEHSLKGDPVKEAAQSLAFQRQIEELVGRCEIQLSNLLQRIEPWRERRSAFPAEVASEVDKFLDLLQKGLTGMLSQVDHRVGEIEKRKAEMCQALGKLSRQRQGIQGYRPPGQTVPRFFEKKT